MGVAAALALALAACTGSPSDGGSSSAPENQALSIGMTSDVATFDPAQSQVGGANQFMLPVFDTLIRLDNDGSLVPMLASSWKYTDDSNTVFELTLRDDVKFSDGTPMTADAVVASLLRFRDGKGPRSTALASVTDVTAVDDTTVRLTLSAPDPALAYNLTLVAGMIVNPAADATALASEPAGAGPYVLDTTATRRGDVYVFTRNENYYDPEAFPFSTLNIKVLTDPTARLNAVKTGQVDATYGLATQVAEAEASGLTVLPSPGGWQGLFLNDRMGVKTPALAEPEVRQAINYAIDRKALLKALALDQGEITTQVFAPGTPAYDDSLDEKYPFDPAKAKQLMAKAGYGDGFTLTMPQLDTLTPAAYPIIQQQLADIGITVVYEPITAAGGLAPFVSDKYSAYMLVWGSSSNWLDATQLLAPTGPFNPFHVDDPEIADLMSQIQLASGEEQDALFKKLSAYVVDQAWFDPWYFNENTMLVGDKVNVVAYPQAIMPPIYNYSPAN
jgi:peptide/nickel transport system substrate-binding protein